MKKILDIGCGNKKINESSSFPDYSFKGKVIGLDYKKSKETDVICDVNKQKLPFRDNSFDIVYSYSTLQYISNPIKVIEEVERVLKKGGMFLVKVPYFSKSANFTQLTFKSNFGYMTFNPFIKSKYRYFEPDIKKQGTFNLIKTKIYFGKLYKYLGVQFLANKFPKVYEGLFCWIFPAVSIKYELQKIT